MKTEQLKYLIATAARRQRTLALGFIGDSNPQIVASRIDCEGKAKALEAVAEAMDCKRMASAFDLQNLTR